MPCSGLWRNSGKFIHKEKRTPIGVRFSVSKNHLVREHPSLLLEEKVSPVRKLVTDVVL